jgi:hypothetical protein
LNSRTFAQLSFSSPFSSAQHPQKVSSMRQPGIIIAKRNGLGDSAISRGI